MIAGKTLSITQLAAVVLLFPYARAHIALWHPSIYGFSQSYTPVTPLANLGRSSWWFHGNLGDVPSESMSLVPGTSLTLQLACDKSFTTYGRNPSSDACPRDSGAYHAGGKTGDQSGWGGNSDANLMGCALAIAFKSDANQVQPDDFIVMSVQERCVRQRDTVFELPSNLPACPPGGCTCAWFWAGKNSALEMYMTGFKCHVQGGVATSQYPRPAEPRRNKISGPTQPFYWANDLNNLGYAPEWANKPSYNSAFGWTNGAQTGAFASVVGTGGSNATGPSTSSSSSSSSRSTATSTTTDATHGHEGGSEETSSATGTRTRPHTAHGSPTGWQNLVADPSVTSISPTASQSATTAATATRGCKPKRHIRRGALKRRGIMPGH